MASDDDEDEFPDHYAVLAIPIKSTRRVVTKAYRRLALKYHPDKNRNNPLQKAMFEKVNKAYTVLLDDKARAIYDAKLRRRLTERVRYAEQDEVRKKMRDSLLSKERAHRRKRSGYYSKTEEQLIREKMKYQIETLLKDRRFAKRFKKRSTSTNAHTSTRPRKKAKTSAHTSDNKTNNTSHESLEARVLSRMRRKHTQQSKQQHNHHNSNTTPAASSSQQHSHEEYEALVLQRMLNRHKQHTKKKEKEEEESASSTSTTK